MNCDTEFRTASFAGIEFEILPSEHSGGRRILTHEYPFLDDHYNEDLGDKPLKWSVKGAFIGEGWRDRLAEAKQKWTKSGAGEFFEPTENRSFQAVLIDWSFSFDSTKLNYVEFSLDLVEKGLEPYLNLGGSGRELYQTALDQYLAGVESAYTLRFNLYADVAEAFRAYGAVRGYFSILGRQFMGLGSFLSVNSATTAMQPTRRPATNFARVVDVMEAAASGNPDTSNQTAFFRMASEVRTPGIEEAEEQGHMAALVALGYYFEALAEKTDYAEMEAFRDRAEALKLAYADNTVSGLIDNLMIALGRSAEPDCRRDMAGTHHALVASYELFGNVSQARAIMALSGGVSGAAMNGITYPCPI